MRKQLGEGGSYTRKPAASLGFPRLRREASAERRAPLGEQCSKGGIKVILGADHGGFALKEALKKHLIKKGCRVADAGAFLEGSSDYPPIGRLAAESVSKKRSDYGIVICKTGFGMAIIANKSRGVRSAVCDTPREAESARRHNDCNVLSLAANRVTNAQALKIADVFLKTPAEGGRHARRVAQIKKFER